MHVNVPPEMPSDFLIQPIMPSEFDKNIILLSTSREFFSNFSWKTVDVCPFRPVLETAA